ncbi:deoxyribodipyrimidine photo-lyase [Litorimonas cladophorae]|uniref:Deoxyribodipyrimidine photo-lyase n=1 Tax=Litorimonas cladophorae TaxID=1220491 RepID=A0A918KSP6_9PROT|nr:deoxyribodipyrimidine photo-lyase [Litorimonas cladophorae]GGX74310.1 deoxyribodipyrimidine photo-lyase [Litorimonas cladophorae]
MANQTSDLKPVLVWLRRDLRLADNPALHTAVESGKPLILLYIKETNAARETGGASGVWLHHSLTALSKDIELKGGCLVLRSGEAAEILDDIIEQTGADEIHWNRRYEGWARDVDAAIKTDLKNRGIKVESHKANLLIEPWEVETKTGGFYKVFTPFWRAAKSVFTVDEPLSAPEEIKPFAGDLDSDDLADWGLLPTDPDWGSKMMALHSPGEAGAADRLASFLDGPVEDYAEQRDRPDDENGTSRLSPHLAFGEISPRQIWTATKNNYYVSDKFLTEIGWREFSYTLLFYNPQLASENYKSDFDKFEWASDEAKVEAWRHGQTGYPFVDAGMRELWQTGWQHNRVRMVCASFLIKHLLTDWRVGEAWYWDTLLEADPASNAASWQWVAGSGADASPYFRIFNPFSQGEKFDKNGDYVRKYLPELKNLPNKYLNQPWTAPAEVLAKAGVKLGETYPKPVVDHKAARERALAAYKESRA